MSVDADTWSGARGTTSEKLLRKLRRAGEDATRLGDAALPLQDGDVARKAKKKRKRDSLDGKLETGHDVKKEKIKPGKLDLQAQLDARRQPQQQPVVPLAKPKRLRNTAVVDLKRSSSPEEAGAPKARPHMSEKAISELASLLTSPPLKTGATDTSSSSRTAMLASRLDAPAAARAVEPLSKPAKGLDFVSRGQTHAVRVGWFPGLYDDLTEAHRQTHHYPLSEQQSFGTRAAAERWLAEPSARKAKDQETRPSDLGHIDKTAFLRFVGRMWANPNRIGGIEDMAQKLKFLFKQACERQDADVDWVAQPLPQTTLLREADDERKRGRRRTMGLWSGALMPRDTNIPTTSKDQAPVKVPEVESRSRITVADISAVPRLPVPTNVRLADRRDPFPVSSQMSTGLGDVPFSQFATTDEEKGRCDCNKAVLADGTHVICAGERCPIRTFHRACVGNPKNPLNWSCYRCRSTAASFIPLSSSQPSVYQSFEAPSSPPPMDVMPTSAPLSASRHEPEPELHPEQLSLISRIVSGANVFYTGSAGTGKSTVLKSFVKRLKDSGKHVDIVAPTGIAALNVGGRTIFAYGGFHPDSLKEPLDDFLGKSWNKTVRARLCKTDVLVIDEISMVDRDMFTRLDLMMREVRAGWQPGTGEKRRSHHGKSFPFGGAQLIVTGDFCQLPPVKPFKFCFKCGGDELPGHRSQDGKPMTCPKCQLVYRDEDKWAFASVAWQACMFEYVELKHIHRQADEVFIGILQKSRHGQVLDAQDREILLRPKPGLVDAVKLLPKKHEVYVENMRNFNALTSTPRRYTCHDKFYLNTEKEPRLRKMFNPKYGDQPDGPLEALNDHRFDEMIQLKRDQLVILLINLDFTTGLVNGSQGRIIGYEKHSDSKVFAPEDKDFGGSPRKGSAKEQSAREILLEQNLRTFITRNKVTEWPVVEFQNGQVQPIYAVCQTSDHGAEPPYSTLCRTQMPLLSAWAITIHKSQGMTLNRVIVDLDSSFEREMVYVALSRARSLEGLSVLRLDKRLDKGINEQVQQFLRTHGLGGCKPRAPLKLEATLPGTVSTGQPPMFPSTAPANFVAPKYEGGVKQEPQPSRLPRQLSRKAQRLQGSGVSLHDTAVNHSSPVLEPARAAFGTPVWDDVDVKPAARDEQQPRAKKELSPVRIYCAGRGPSRIR